MHFITDDTEYPLLLFLLLLQDEAFGDFVARVGFAALRQYAQGYVPADKSGSLATVSTHNICEGQLS